MRRYLGRMMLAGAALLGLSALASAPAAADDIVVGFATAKSGWMAAWDTPAKQAALLRIDELNAAGGLLGRKIRVVEGDTKTDVAEGAKVAADLIGQGADLLIVSCDYDMGVSAASTAERAGKISFFLCAEDAKAGAQGVGPHAFTASAAANVQGAAIGEWAYKNLNVRNAYVLLDDTIQYDKSTCAGFKWRFTQLEGAAIVGEDSFKNGDPSIASQITRIKGLSKAPDAIMLCSYVPGGASAARQIRAAGIEIPILAGTGMDGTYWLDSAPGLSKFYVTEYGSVRGDDPIAKVNEFVKGYTAKYGSAPPNTAVFGGAALIELWAAGVKAAGSTEPDAVVAAMEKLADVPTVVGPRGFTHELHIQNKAHFVIAEVDNGKMKVVGEWVTEQPIPLDVLLKR